ncbi:MAG: Cof-type HAD-IIB family hydrolase [Acutalibacteraceae bacterium]|nr:Cof-type HAD-IIB family hydrolase [Acutalibacteraceae bacterium]
MKYKLIAIDLDGTLLNDDKEISDKNMNAILCAIENGILVVPCTGRAIQGITKYNFLANLNSPAIAYNGGMIVNLANNEMMFHCPLLKKDAEFIVKKGIEIDTNICVWIDNTLYCNKINIYTLEYSKISSVSPIQFNEWKDISGRVITKILWYDKEYKINEYLHNINGAVSEDVTCCTSKPWFLEFFNSKTSKALALQKLCDLYNISRKELVAVGDELNDISMIEFAGLGVAMKNAKNEVKEKANYIIGSNNKSAVADLIYNIILK